MIEINSIEQLENIVEEGFSNRQKQTLSKTNKKEDTWWGLGQEGYITNGKSG